MLRCCVHSWRAQDRAESQKKDSDFAIEREREFFRL